MISIRGAKCIGNQILNFLVISLSLYLSTNNDKVFEVNLCVYLRHFMYNIILLKKKLYIDTTDKEISVTYLATATIYECIT
jgi:hypothetical protein